MPTCPSCGKYFPTGHSSCPHCHKSFETLSKHFPKYKVKKGHIKLTDSFRKKIERQAQKLMLDSSKSEVSYVYPISTQGIEVNVWSTDVKPKDIDLSKNEAFLGRRIIGYFRTRPFKSCRPSGNDLRIAKKLGYKVLAIGDPHKGKVLVLMGLEITIAKMRRKFVKSLKLQKGKMLCHDVNPKTIMKEVTRKILKDFNLKSSYEINCGHCEEWADEVGRRIPEAEVVGTPEKEFMNTDWGVGHVWVVINGIHYDAETQEGVNNWRSLKIFVKTRSRESK